MSEQLRESVSALMDGEAGELELRRVLSEENAEAVNKAWSSYHLARDAMQGSTQSSRFSHMDISSRVSAAIQQEADASEAVALEESVVANDAANDTDSAWWKPAAGFAVAASVAVAVVFGVQTMSPETNPGFDSTSPTLDFAAQTHSPVTSGRVFPVSGAGVQVAASNQPSLVTDSANYRIVGVPRIDRAADQAKVAADLEIQKKLNSYMLRHTEQAALNNGQGMISFARVASFEE